jgi:hypothetical protein
VRYKLPHPNPPLTKGRGPDSLVSPKGRGLDSLISPKGRGLDSLVSPLSKGGLRGVKYPTFYGILPHPNPPLTKGRGLDSLISPKGRGLDSLVSPLCKGGLRGVFLELGNCYKIGISCQFFPHLHIKSGKISTIEHQKRSNEW